LEVRSLSVISICLANTGCAAIFAISAISAGHKKTPRADISVISVISV
jgi:hypothetical protein